MTCNRLRHTATAHGHSPDEAPLRHWNTPEGAVEFKDAVKKFCTEDDECKALAVARKASGTRKTACPEEARTIPHGINRVYSGRPI